ncbi:MAG: FHA domain-containing protein [Anaerolineales bacterium]|nr:FHA domain-containing protein [Anaerolineales bacterium]
MAYVAVTLEYGRDKTDLALPMQVPCRLILDGLAQTLKLTKQRGQGYFLGIQSEQGLRRISANASLGDAGVLHGTTLTLLEDKQSEAPIPQTGAFLKAENGSIYPLTSKTTLIGRTDAKSGIFVEIDLASMVADYKIISRRHAQIEQEGDRFYLVDLVSVNGTKLNGQRIPPKEKKPVWDGDVIEFGRNGVQMVFQGGEK